MKPLFKIFSLALFASVLLFSCSKNDEDIVPFTIPEDHSQVEMILEEMYRIGDRAQKGDLDYIFTAECGERTTDTNNVLNNFTLDFGEEGCMCADGKIRSGALSVAFNGDYDSVGTTMVFLSKNYFVDSFRVDGGVSMEYQGKNNLGQPFYSVEVDARIVKPGDVGSVILQGNRTRTWVAGNNSETFLDDVFEVSGSVEGESITNLDYTANIISNLRFELNCDYITKGEIKIDPIQEKSLIINYGGGDCDNKAIVNQDGSKREITF